MVKRHVLVTFAAVVSLSILSCSTVWADTLAGLSDVTVVNGEIISLRYEGIEYVVANGDLTLGTTTRWYIVGGVETLWVDGDPAPAATVPTASTPKVSDTGAKGDNFQFTVNGATDISSIDGIDFQKTIFPSLTDTFFVFERGGNDAGTYQAIFADGTLGAPVSIATAGAGGPYANTGVSVNGQNAFGVVFKTDVPVQGVRINAPGHDTLSISTPSGATVTQAHNPQPEDKAKSVPVVGAVLSWTTGVNPADPNTPNPAITGHNLWLSIPYDPMNSPATPDWENPQVQIFQIPADTNPADGKIDATVSRSVTLQRDALYYWIVDESLGAANPREWSKLIQGAQWSFETVTSGPEVDAGSSIVTWLKAGTTTVDLNGIVADQTGDVTTIRWSVVASPPGSTFSIANNALAATKATFSQTGEYVLELHAVDATQQQDADLMQVKVYADSCEAAKNNPAGYTAPAHDFNGDCRVDFADFALFAATWLLDETLTDDALYDAGTFTVPLVQFTNPLNLSTVSGQVTINAIAYDPGVGTTDGDGMLGAGYVRFEIIDSSGAVLATQNENTATFDMTWNTAQPLYPNGVYTIRVTAESDAGYRNIKQISVTVRNP
jgi:hypothetical protein